jgi:GntR family transcriptional repressor for pyruvate dehydrogenase complex
MERQLAGKRPERLTPVSRVSVPATVFEQLLSYIVRGDWEEGQRIPPERELSLRLGVARPSLREALKALEIIGLIESRVGAGTFVRKRSDFLSRPLLWAIAGSSSTDVIEIVESRLVLEVELAGFAATRANEADIQTIEESIEELKSNIADAGSLLEADLKFHLAIAEAAHNQVLFNAVLMIRNLMRQWMLVTLHIPGIVEKVIEQHTAICGAIKARDSVQARDQMRRHLEEMGALLLRAKSTSE